MVELGKQSDSANLRKPKSDAIYILFLIPVFVVLGFLDFYPIAWTINISLTNFSEAHFFTFSYVGLRNFYNVLTSPTLSTVIINNIVFAGSSILLMAGLGFGVALLITQPGLKGKNVFRSLILVPWAFPAFITILIWKNLLDQHYGAVNQVLSLIFHISPNWTGSTPLAMISVIFVNLWLSLAYYTFVYTASLQSIPQELYDAAQMDGYGTLSRVRTIVLPLLSRQIAFITIFGFIFAWSNFYIPYLLTAGEPGISTQILITYSYTEAFSYLSYGVAAVYSIISVLILLVMVIIVNHYSKMMSILY